MGCFIWVSRGVGRATRTARLRATFRGPLRILPSGPSLAALAGRAPPAEDRPWPSRAPASL
eukprot:8016798-Pyramimonas_sp.AAC.1